MAEWIQFNECSSRYFVSSFSFSSPEYIKDEHGYITRCEPCCKSVEMCRLSFYFVQNKTYLAEIHRKLTKCWSSEHSAAARGSIWFSLAIYYIQSSSSSSPEDIQNQQHIRWQYQAMPSWYQAYSSPVSTFPAFFGHSPTMEESIAMFASQTHLTFFYLSDFSAPFICYRARLFWALKATSNVRCRHPEFMYIVHVCAIVERLTMF